jgi:SAM-dependent methyltransferase
MSSLCEVCNPSRYVDPDWMRIHLELESYSVDKHVFAHTNGGHVYRKGWEWTHCIYGLKQLGMLQPANCALGVGAGREPLIYYFGDQLNQVTALDLYGNEQWTNEANADVLRHPERWCPKPADFQHIRFVTGDGTKLNFADGQFDFCWSLSSIEHFGGHEAAAVSMREMARVTKSGGIVAVATEYLLLPEYRHPEYFNACDLERHIIAASPDLRLVSDINWGTLPPEYLTDSIVVPQGVDRRRRHVVLNDGEVQWTSILMFLRKDQPR